MLEIKWGVKDRGRVLLYWIPYINSDDLKNRYWDCDLVELWYPRKVDGDIIAEWDEMISYISLDNKWGERGSTRIIDLEKTEQEIFGDFSKTTRYEIRRAKERDSLRVEHLFNITEETLDSFIEFHNKFTDTKNLGHIDVEKLYALKQNSNLVISKVFSDDNILLAVHSYIFKGSERAELHTSSSLFREKEYSVNSALISRANRYLHYCDILYFKKLGVPIYDLGGVYLKTDNEEYANVARFKSGFGGEIELSDTGMMIPVRQIKKIDGFAEKMAYVIRRLNPQQVVVWGYNSNGKYFIRKLSRQGIRVEVVIDNKIEAEADGRLLHNSDYLTHINPAETVLICMMSVNTFEQVKQEPIGLGFKENYNIWNLG